MESQITLLLPTYNCANYLQNCLESVKWVDQILLIDSFSTDNTLEIAKRYNAKILQHEYINSAKQKNWALQFINTEWTLQIDSDEILDTEAEILIRSAIRMASSDVECFRFPRKNHMLGKWVKYGGMYPDWENRLFRTDKGQWFDREVHSNIKVEGFVDSIRCDILHFGMPNISKQLKNIDRYTRYEADELFKNATKFSWFRILLFPFLIFLHRFFWLQGFRDGWRGFFLAKYTSFYYFLYWFKFFEMKFLDLKKSP